MARKNANAKTSDKDESPVPGRLRKALYKSSAKAANPRGVTSVHLGAPGKTARPYQPTGRKGGGDTQSAEAKKKLNEARIERGVPPVDYEAREAAKVAKKKEILEAPRHTRSGKILV